MRAVDLAFALGIALVPAALAVGLSKLLRGAARRQRAVAVAALLGLGAGLSLTLVERTLGHVTGLSALGGASTWSNLAYAFLVVTPLEQGLAAVAALPLLRSLRNERPTHAMQFVALTALGVVSVRAAGHALAAGASGALLGRALVMVVGHVAFASMWGYVLGITRRRRLGGAPFDVTWLLSVVFAATLDHLLLSRGPAALVAAIPLTLTAVAVALVLVRVASRAAPRRRRASLGEIPTLDALREALRTRERPIAWVWIPVGVLVNAGVLTTTFAIAVVVGRRLGVDFGSVDRSELGAALAPLSLIAVGLVAAFPLAGYLIARASRVSTVLEPALAAIGAIAGLSVMMGVAAPVALVFAVASAPIAFALACFGAWIGLDR